MISLEGWSHEYCFRGRKHKALEIDHASCLPWTRSSVSVLGTSLVLFGRHCLGPFTGLKVISDLPFHSFPDQLWNHHMFKIWDNYVENILFKLSTLVTCIHEWILRKWITTKDDETWESVCCAHFHLVIKTDKLGKIINGKFSVLSELLKRSDKQLFNLLLYHLFACVLITILPTWL